MSAEALFSLTGDDDNDEDDEDDEKGGGDDLVFSRTIVGAGEAARSPPKALYTLTVLSAIGGFLFGYDTGVVSGAMILVRKEFSLSNFWHELIVSATVGSALIFSLVGARLSDRLGRKPTILGASVLFTVGAFFMGMASGKWMLLLGRVVVGMAIGLSSMSVPMYIAESCPASKRGVLVMLNNAFITGGQFCASIFCGALAATTEGWRYMLGLAALPAIVQFFGFVSLPESPRHLVMKGKYDEAAQVLGLLRNQYDDVHEELEDMKVSAQQEGSGVPSQLQKIFASSTTRRALFVGCCLQLFQQLCGINTVMYYSATIISMAGVGDDKSAIWLAALTSLFNFAFTFVGMHYVDKIGRRPLLFASLGGVVFSLLLLSSSFALMELEDYPVVNDPARVSSSTCGLAAFCSKCVAKKECGFCLQENAGRCLPVKSSSLVPRNCSAPSEWFATYCPSSLSWLPVVGLCLYLLFFAPGMGPLPWTINTELYPTWCRASCAGIATAVNWGSNLLVSISFLTILDLLGKPGAFGLYAMLGLLGLVLFFFKLPETKGLSLEETESLFGTPTKKDKVIYSRLTNPLD